MTYIEGSHEHVLKEFFSVSRLRAFFVALLLVGISLFLFVPRAHAITISGQLTTYEEGAARIQGATIKLAIATTSTVFATTTTTNTDGEYSFNIGIVGTSTPILVWVDASTTVRAAAFTKTASPVPSVSLPLYQNRVIISHEGPTTSTSTTIRDLSFYDSDDDSDIQFNATSTLATTTLNIFTGKLYIYPGKTFLPGGNVTVSGGAGAGVHGDLHVADNATYVAPATTTIGGSLTASSTATIYPYGIFALTATTTGKSILAAQPLGNLIFQNTQSMSFATSATTTNVTINPGATVVAPPHITITGDYTNNGTFNHNSGTTTFMNNGPFWTGRVAAAANTWYSVTYGLGSGTTTPLFVAVSSDGTNRVMTSPDGISWTSRQHASTSAYYEVTYGNGTYVAVGINAVMRSTDGTTWATSTPAAYNTWASVTHGNGLFVAVACGVGAGGCNTSGGGYRVMTSPDGVTWTSQQHASSSMYYSIAYGNGTYVAVGDKAVMRSTNGTTWATSTPAAYNTWRSVTYGNGTFVAVSSDGTNRVMTSPDGITWTARSASAANTWYFATYGNGLFVAVSNDNNRTSTMISLDGITWSSRSLPEGNYLNSVTYGGGMFVAVGTQGFNRVMTATATGVMTPDVQYVRGSATGTSAFNTLISTGPSVHELVLETSASTTNLFVAQGIFRLSTSTLSVSGHYTNKGNVGNIAGNTRWIARTAATTNWWYGVTYGNGLFVAVSGNGSRRVMTSPDGVTWTSQQHASSSVYYSIAYGNGTYVAVGINAVMRSTDGTTWATSTPAAYNTWNSVTYGNGTFVAVSFNGTNRVMTSPDGITWTARSASAANTWYSVTYGLGSGTTTPLFVAVSSDGTDRVMTSPDGITWTARTASSMIIWRSVTYGNGTFVAIACGSSACGDNVRNGLIMTSPDGVTWTERSAPEESRLMSVTYGNGLFVAVINYQTASMAANIAVATSPDGITWTTQSASDNNDSWQSVTYGKGIFVAVSDSGNSVMTSHNATVTFNGTSAQTATGTMTGASAFGNLAFSDTGVKTFGENASTTNMTVVAGATFVAPARLTLTGDYINNGTTTYAGSMWKVRSAASSSAWLSVTHDNDLFVAVGTNAVMTSPDGVTWTPRTAAEANTWYSVTYGNGTFVAIANDGTNQVMTSPDGITWTARSAAAATSWYSVTYGGGIFVAVGYNAVMTSSDGISWTSRTPVEENQWRSVTYGNGLFVAVADTGSLYYVMTSPDGTTWTGRSAAAANYWTSVTYGNGLFVAVSENGTNRVMTSPDGTTWTGRSAPGTNWWRSVTYGNGLFIAVSDADFGNTGYYVMTSPDGLSWTGRTDTSGAWKSVTYGGNIFVAVATNYIMSTTDNTLYLAGVATQTLSGTMTGKSSFRNLTVTNTSGLGSTTQSVVFAAKASTTGTFTMTASTSARFPASATSTFQNISLEGEAGRYVILRSSTNGTRYSILVPGTQNVTNVNVRDSSACPYTVNAYESSVNAGNNACWVFTTDSGATFILSGRLYADEGITPITSGETLGIAVGTTTTSRHSTLTNASGYWTFDLGASHSVGTSTPILVFVDGDANTRAALFTKASNTRSISNLALYEDRVIISHEGTTTATSTTITNMSFYDADNDNDVQYTANGSVLTVFTGNELHIQAGKVFSASGTVEVRGNAQTAATDGSLHIATGARYISTGTTTLAGSFIASSSALYTAPTSTLLFNATTTGKSIYTSLTTLGTTTFNGSGGGWVFYSSATTSNLTARAGEVTLPLSGFALTGDYINTGATLTQNNSPITFNSNLAQTASGTMTGTSALGNVTFIGTGVKTFSNAASTTNFTVVEGATVVTPAQLSVAGTYTNTGTTTHAGAQWTARAAAELNSWNSVTYGNGTFVAVSYDGTNRVMTSSDGVIWTPQSVASNAWYDVTYGEGLFVAVACGVSATTCNTTAGNRIMTSPDGVTWTTRAAPQANSWRSVTYGNGTFVSVSADGSNRVMTSDDGVTWTARNEAQANTWHSVTYGEKLFVAVAGDGTNRVMTSPDGITWTARSAAEVNAWRSVAYGNERFVAVSYDGTNRVMTSEDGITWTARAAAEGNAWKSIVYGGGIFVAVSSDGTNRVMTSPDGITWVSRAATEANSWQSVTYGNGTFAAVAYSGTNRVMTSTKTTLYLISTSTEQTATGTMTGISALGNLVFSGGGVKIFGEKASTTNMTVASGATFVAPEKLTVYGDYANNGTTTYTAGSKWNYYTAPDIDWWEAVTYGNGTFVAVAGWGPNHVMRSTNGVTWATSSPAVIEYSWQSVTYGNGTFVALASSPTTTTNAVMTSPDGITWTPRSSVAGHTSASVTYGNGTFVAVGYNAVMTSPDGITWTAQTDAGENANWASVTYGNGTFVAVGNNETVMTSPDGITWTAQTDAGENANWASVTYGNGTFVAVGYNAVMTSPDGITWTEQTDAGELWAYVTYGNGLFVASTQGSKQFMTSPDGVTWTLSSVQLDTTSQWYEVAYGAGKFVTIGKNGTYQIATSEWGEVVFGGASAQSVSGSLTGASAFGKLTIGSGSSTTLASNASTTQLTIAASSTLIAPASLSLTGNYTNNGTFLAGTGLVTLKGSEQQTLSGTMVASSSFRNLTIENTSASGSTTQSVVFAAKASTTGTFTMLASTSAQFPANATSTFQNITIDGEVGRYVVLRSSTPNTRYAIVVPGTQDVTYVDVRDSSACPFTITAYSSLNSGNNTCWTFAVPSGDLSSAAHQTFGYQQATTAISMITITDTGSITAANDIRIRIATTSAYILWDTTDTTAVFGGTASAKVANPVSYEAGGSILVIPVSNDFANGETLTVSGLSYASFATVTTATTALGIRVGGAGTAVDNTDDKTMAIYGMLTLANHTDGQVTDNFSFSDQTETPLYAFKLTPGGEAINITNMIFDLTGIRGLVTGDITNAKLYRDLDSNGAYTAGDVAVGGSGSVSINGQAGTITFSTTFLATTTQNFILVADLADLKTRDSLTVSLSSADFTLSGVVTSSGFGYGTLAFVQHMKGSAGGSSIGSSGAIGGDAPAGQGVTTGGSQGGGDIDPNTGDSIGNEPGFVAPAAHGSPDNSWTNGGDAYSSNGVYTSTSGNSARQSYGNFVFNIPSNNTVTGIELKIEGSGSTAAGNIGVELSWNGGDSSTAQKITTTLTTSDAVYTLGGPSDMWGHSWTPAELNNTSWFRVTLIGNTSGNTVRADAIQVKVYHQATGGGGGGGGAVFEHDPYQNLASAHASLGEKLLNFFKRLFGW